MHAPVHTCATAQSSSIKAKAAWKSIHTLTVLLASLAIAQAPGNDLNAATAEGTDEQWRRTKQHQGWHQHLQLQEDSS